MMKVEIAGITITYRSAAELSVKVRQEIQDAREQRGGLEKECRGLRDKEKALERFLGEPILPPAKNQTGGSHVES